MSTYDALTKIIRQHPELILDNQGYENLAYRDPEATREIEEILRARIKGFVSFQNFKPRPDGTYDVRYQVHYNDEGSFTGVAYTPLGDLRNG